MERDKRGRFTEGERARQDRIGREHTALLAGLLGGSQQPPPPAQDADAVQGSKPPTFWSTSSESTGQVLADLTPRTGMDGGWRGDDSRAHVRQQEAEREAHLDQAVQFITGKPRTVGRRWGDTPAVDPCADDE